MVLDFEWIKDIIDNNALECAKEITEASLLIMRNIIIHDKKQKEIKFQCNFRSMFNKSNELY